MNNSYKDTETVGNKSRKLWGHTSSSVAYCEFVY
jgi:hypothetical protein